MPLYPEVVEFSKQVIDVFCGAGVGALGLRQAGFQHVLGVDHNALALLSYATNFRCPIAETDLGKIGIAEVLYRNNVSRRWNGLFWVSSPCTDFSSAGSRGVNGSERNNLLLVSSDVASYAPQSWIVAENVINCKRSGQYDELMKRMKALDRKCCSPFELNAKDFGLAQSRGRLFLIFPPAGFHGHVEKPMATGAATLRDQIGTGFKDVDPEFVPLSLTEAVIYKDIPPGGNWTASERGRKYATIKKYDRKNQFLKRPGWDEISPCLMASGGSQRSTRVQSIHPDGRGFSVGEQRVLMGISDPNFILCGTIEERIRQVGNGVAVPVARAIGERILQAVEREKSLTLVA